MVWSPRRQAAGVFRSIDFFRVDARNILSLVMYRSGLIRTRVIPVEEDVDPSDLIRMSSFVNKEFAGLPPEELREKIFQKVEEEIWEFILKEALGLRDSGLEEGKVYIEGQLNILDLPDFSDRKRLRGVLKALEEKRKIIQLLNQTLKEEGMRVFIGVEEMFQELKGISLVSTAYGTGEVLLGSLGVLGPTRMDYSRIIPLVEYTSEIVSDLLTQN
jgi:heat-inducible transcriptional repressor